MKYIYTQSVQTPEGALNDDGTTYVGTAAVVIENEDVPANGDPANVLAAHIPTAGLKCIFLLATVPCVVTLTGSDSAPALVAGQLTRLTALNANVTGISVGANTVGDGPAGVITIRALYDATP